MTDRVEPDRSGSPPWFCRVCGVETVPDPTGRARAHTAAGDGRFTVNEMCAGAGLFVANEQPAARTEARPCACGHLTNRHNALVSGPCPVLGCDCPDFREPGPEVEFAPEQYPVSSNLTGLGGPALAELNAYRQVITEALGYTGPGLSHAELRAYAADAIRIARTVPPEVRYGETVTTVDPESGSPADVDPDIHTLASRLESPRAGE